MPLSRSALGISLLALACVVLFGLLNSPIMMHYLVSADTLLPAQMVWDMASHDYARMGFEFPRVLSLFPDLALYAPLQLVLTDWRLALGVYLVVMALLAALAIGLVLSRMSGRGFFESAVGATCFFALMMFLAVQFSGAGVAAPDNSPFVAWFWVLLPVAHGGPFVLSLFAAWYGARLLEGDGSRWLLCGLCFIGTLSDPLFLIWFVVPFLLAGGGCVLTRRARGEDLLRVGPLAFLSGLAGFDASFGFFRQPEPDIELGAVPQHLRDWFADIPHQPNAWVALAVLAVVVVFAVWKAMRWSGTRRVWRPGETYFLIFGLAASVLSLIPVVVFYLNAGSMRYAQPLLWWPAILLLGSLKKPPPLPRFGGRVAAFAGATVLLGISAAAQNGIRTPWLLRWHSPTEACLTQARQDFRLHAGLADYWTARPLEASSQWQMQIDQINDSGLVRIWGNDVMAYFRDQSGVHEKLRYDYILVNAASNQPRLIANYGRPDRVIACPGAAVWTYEDPDHLRPLLLRYSGGFRNLVKSLRIPASVLRQ